MTVTTPEITDPREASERPAAPLRDVPGPSALGGGRRRAFDLLLVIAINDFKRTYFGTVLGYLWSIARPLMQFAVLLLVFTHVFHFSHRVNHYPVFLLFDIVFFGFFQEATSMAVSSIVQHESVIRKTQFPRLVIPLAVVFTSVFNLSLNLVVAFVFVLGSGISPALSWFGLIPVLALMLVFTVAVSMIVSALYPRYRDVSIIWAVVAMALFYATPVLYPISVVSHSFRDVIALNPLAPIMDLVQRWITQPNTPWPWVAQMGGPVRLAVAMAIFVMVCGLAVLIFRREAPRIAEQL
jgi:ABC-2 type transport system permease protein